MYSIYLFTNRATNEKYVGYSIDQKSRFSSHCNANTPLGKAIRSFGVDKFDYEIIHQTDTLIEAKDIELFYIKFFNTVERGYNQVCASSGPSEEGKRKIAKARKGMIVVKDAKTEKIVGSFPRNHPKIQTGEWVHYSKGLTLVWDPFLNKRKRVPFKEKEKYSAPEFKIPGQSAETNGRYSGYTREKIISLFQEYCDQIERFCEDPKIFSGANFNRWARNKDINFPNFPGCIKSFRFPEIVEHTGTKLKFLVELCLPKEKWDKFLKWEKTKDDKHRKKLSEINLGKKNA